MLLAVLFQHFVVSIHPGMALSWLSAENLEAVMEWMEGTKYVECRSKVYTSPKVWWCALHLALKAGKKWLLERRAS